MPTTRRDFLRQAGAVAIAGAASSTLTREARAASANDRFTVGFIACGGQAKGLMHAVSNHKDVDVAWLCDPDSKRLSDAKTIIAESFENAKTPQTTGDFRHVLDDKSVDAVFIATPDHWHAPATLLALAAGKHVYVEKPASHNIREGRMMVDAARKANRVVQLGTQSRSTAHVLKAMQLLKDGAIGEILVAKAWNSQFRGNIGKKKPTDAPKELDYDTWVGPVPFTPYSPNKLHYNWRWWHDYGTADIGNDGVHDIDIARWGLGVETHPNHVGYFGGQFVLHDTDQQWPDTYYVTYGYDLPDGRKKQLVYEQRTWCPYKQEGIDNGDAFYGTKGMMLLCKEAGWRIIKAGNIAGDKMEADGVDLPGHTRNFLDCIKSGERPHADIEIGHLSSCLSHLGNIASRVGRGFAFDPKTEQVIGDEEANKFTGREYREHWGTPKIG
jgi:predicted dehydrogenase